MPPPLRLVSAPEDRPLSLSFEFFPPRNERMQRCLWRNVGQLELLGPSFFSVTYGAGGSERARSLEVLEQLQSDCPVPVAAHLTSAGHRRDEVLDIADTIHARGIRHFVALRGDAEAVAGGFEDTADFVHALQQRTGAEISVAAYPQVHPRAADADSDLARLRDKLDAGAARALSQYFFDPHDFLRFRDRAAAAGIDKPLVPGVLPIHDFAKVLAFSERCGAQVPPALHTLFEGTEGNTAVQHALAVDVAVELCETLLAEGVRDLHFYTLNTPSLTFEVTRQLGVPTARAIATAA